MRGAKYRALTAQQIKPEGWAFAAAGNSGGGAERTSGSGMAGYTGE